MYHYKQSSLPPTLTSPSALWMPRPLSSSAVTLAPLTTVLKRATSRMMASLETCVSLTLFWTSPPLSHPRECCQASPLRMTLVLVRPVTTGHSVFPMDSPMSVCADLLSLGRTVRKVRNWVAFVLPSGFYLRTSFLGGRW